MAKCNLDKVNLEAMLVSSYPNNSGGDPMPLVGAPPDLHTQLPLLAVPRNVSSLKPSWLLAIFVLFYGGKENKEKKLQIQIQVHKWTAKVGS